MLCLGEIKTRGNHLQLKKGEYNMSENNPACIQYFKSLVSYSQSSL